MICKHSRGEVSDEGLLGDCAHFYDARPNAMSWTNDN